MTPSSTTSGIPPTALATTAVSQPIASRFTMPSGSYTDGQTKTVACVSSCTTSARGSISLDPDHAGALVASRATARFGLGGDLGRVRRAGTQHQLDRRIEPVGRAPAGARGPSAG